MKQDTIPYWNSMTQTVPEVTEQDILEGLDLNQFEVYYQPILQNGRVISGEALVRWNHPKEGLLLPSSFIPVAEKTGAILPLGEFVFREACAQTKIWKDKGYDFYHCTINLSIAQLSDTSFPDLVNRILKETEVTPDDIALEITESMAMIDPEVTKGTLIQMDKMGVKILLDDFGTGYSSLGRLGSFPVHGLKIDAQFIRHALNSDKESKILESIIFLGHTLKLGLIAEGVETKEELEILKSMNCHTVQGYYFSRPIPTKTYEAWCLHNVSENE